MTAQQIEFVRRCIDDNCMIRFYTWGEWLRVRSTALNADKRECQKCKGRGKYTPATMVHHVNHVRDCPELALEIFYIDLETGEKKRQLVSLCKGCHEEEHPERFKQNRKKKPLTIERW